MPCEDFFESGFEQAPISIAYLHPDLRWARINQEFCDLLGYSHDELWRLHCDEILPVQEMPRMAAFRQRMLHGAVHSAKIETRLMRKDRQVIDVEIRSALMTSRRGTAGYFIDVVEDITELKAARKVARETAENYRLLVEGAVDHAIIRMDKQGRIASWNTGAAAIFGYEEQEILGKSAAILFMPEDVTSGQHEREMATAEQDGRSDDDRWHVRKDGSRLWASGVVTPVKDEQGNHNGFVKILRDLTDRKLAEERSTYLSQHDHLTTLPNRRKFNEDLLAAMNAARPRQTSVGVLFIDLDRFKHINDALGHHFGDALLVSAAERLVDAVGKSDVVARLGGDEFGVIRSSTDRSDVAQLANKLIKALARSFFLQNHKINIGATIGISMFPQDGDDPNQLLTFADMAMYHAKKNGRATFQFYTANLDVEAKRRGTIEEELRSAIVRNELYLHYQPQVDLENYSVCSVEALVRWKNTRLAPFTTEEFIALADETGLIVPIGKWVLRNACKQAKAWQDTRSPALRVAVNVSSRQLQDPGFAAMVDETLRESGLDPHCLELEITERLLMEDNLKNNSVLRLLKARGIQVSVDDFGTGFSSLGYLKHFPIDSLKIDKMFIKCLPDDQHDAAIASAIIGMAHSLKLRVVAEGVESTEQLKFLRDLGCNCGQGYLFSEPLPSDAINQMLARNVDFAHLPA